MKKLLISFLITIFACCLFAGSAHQWNFNEGEGFKETSDTIGGLKARIQGNVSWAREDDRGWFLNFNKGSVEVAPTKELSYPEGFIAEIKFSVNFALCDKPQASLFSYGNSWAVLLDCKNGDISVNLADITPKSIMADTKLFSNRDYRLVLIIGGNTASILLDGKSIATVSVSGKLLDNTEKLTIGSTASYPFCGNIYSFKVQPYSKSEADKLSTRPAVAKTGEQNVSAFPPLDLQDPQGTVIVSDFNQFNPKPNVSANGWLYRPNAHFITNTTGILNPPASYGAPVLEYSPNLKGKYDVYAGVRTFTRPGQMVLGFGNDFFSISLPGTGEKVHHNAELLIAKAMEMEDRSIKLQSLGKFFALGYVKFIPSSNARKKDYPPIDGVEVSKVQALSREYLENEALAKIEEQIAQGYFRQRYYIEKTPMPIISKTSSDRGYILFERNWMDLVWENTVPSTDKGIINLSAAACGGEQIPLAFGLRALRPLEKVSVRQVSDFKTAQGVNGDFTVQICVVENRRKRTTNYTGQSEFMDMPYYLEPVFPQNANENTTREYILLVKPGEGTKPGDYSANFAIETKNGRETVPVKISVYPFELDRFDDLYYGFWTNLSPDQDHEAARQTIREQAPLANSIMVNAGHIIELTITNNSCKIDWKASVLSSLADEMKKQKMGGRIFLLSTNLYRTMPTENREQAYISVLQEIVEKGKAEGWPEIVFNSIDEVLSKSRHFPEFLEEIKLQKKAGVKTANDHIWFKTSRPLQKEVDEASPYIDIFINRFNTRNLWYVDDWKTMMKTAKEKGVELIAYNSNNALTCSQTAAMRFANGWFMRSELGNGCKGQLIWVWKQVHGMLDNDLDGSDWTYIVPPHHNKKGGPTLECLGLIAGFSDMRYVRTLENTIAKAKKKGKDTAKAEKLLADIVNSLDCDSFLKNSVFFNSQWSESYEKNGKLCASGVWNVSNGWKLEDYDKNRVKVAEAIIELNQ
ncbi:MAG: hypothetical protein IKP00_01535 [Victivallales bacterium]|nr:hypothetical protein [Victivallales bacterium]